VIDIKTPKGIIAQILSEEKDTILSIPVLLTIYSGEKPGSFEKQIIIKTNDKEKLEILFSISGIVIGEAKAYPPMDFFGETESENEVIRESTITSTTGKNLIITKIEAQSSFISTELQPVEYGKKYKLITKLLANEKNITVRDTLSVFAEGKTIPVLEIPVYARIVGSNE
jgi:hypothetical protein